MSLSSQTADDLRFGSDRGVVGTRYPAGVVKPPLTCTAHEDILDTIIEHVPHVQHTRDVGGRDDDGIGRAMIGVEWKSLCCIQYSYHLFSTASGLYLVANSIIVDFVMYLYSLFC